MYDNVGGFSSLRPKLMSLIFDRHAGLQKNVDRLSKTFGRAVIGVHNKRFLLAIWFTAKDSANPNQLRANRRYQRVLGPEMFCLQHKGHPRHD